MPCQTLLLGDAAGLAGGGGGGGASAGRTVGRAVVRLSTEMECGTFFKVAHFGQAFQILLPVNSHAEPMAQSGSCGVC